MLSLKRLAGKILNNVGILLPERQLLHRKIKQKLVKMQVLAIYGIKNLY
jgi:hypothetical protein